MKLYILEKNRSTFTGKTAGNLIYSINIFTGLLEISMFFYDMTSVIEINLIYLTILESNTTLYFTNCCGVKGFKYKVGEMGQWLRTFAAEDPG